MKTLLLLVAVAVAVVHSLPHPEYEMVADDLGNLKLVNINEEAVEPESFFNAVTDTRYLLFTRGNRDTAQLIVVGTEQSLQQSNFNPSHPTR